MENGTTTRLSPRCESGKDVFLPERYVRSCVKLIVDGLIINEGRERNSCGLSYYGHTHINKTRFKSGKMISRKNPDESEYRNRQ
jgi:hypothetical protein